MRKALLKAFNYSVKDKNARKHLTEAKRGHIQCKTTDITS